MDCGNVHVALLNSNLKLGDALASSGKLQGLEILDQGTALVGSEQRADDSLARANVKLVAGVAVAPDGSVKLEATRNFLGAIADVDRIVFAIAEIESFRTLCDRRE